MKSQQALEYLAKQLVDEPDAVEVVAIEEDRTTILELHVADDDKGKVIGRRGRTAKALRTVIRAVASMDDDHVTVEIID